MWYLKDIEAGETAVAVAGDARLVAGRGSTVDLTLRDPGVSRRHFEVENRTDRLHVRDLGSKGGTYVNGKQIQEADVGPGDRIDAGSSRLVVLQVQPKVPPSEAGKLEMVHYRSGSVVARIPLGGPMIVGRSSECDLVIDDTRVSRRHLEIQPNGSDAVVVALAPHNRTDVNGRELTGRRVVGSGDRIQLAGIDEVLAIESPEVAAGPIQVEIVEGDDTKAVEIDASNDATVEDVAAQVSEYLGRKSAGGGVVTFLHRDAGVVLHPTNRWHDAGVRRGDRLELLSLDDTVDGPEQTIRYGPPRVVLNQLPRSVNPPDTHHVRAPRPPESTSLKGRGVSWQIVGGMGIIVAGIIMVFINPAYAPFAVIGGIVGVISVGSGIMGEQSRRKHGVGKFQERISSLDRELEEARRSQASSLHAVNPSPSEVAKWIASRDRRLWERRPGDSDFLRLRIGLGRRIAPIEVSDLPTHSDSPLASQVVDLLHEHRYLDEVPILTPTPGTAPILGLVGTRRDVHEVASWILIQSAALHSPAELEIAIPAVNQDWMWARWIPHVESSDGVDVTSSESDAAALARRISVQAGDEPGLGHGRQLPRRLVIVPHGSSEILADGMSADKSGETLYVVLADRASELPSRIDAVITLDENGAVLDGPNQDGVVWPVVVDRINHDTASALARTLGRYVDARKPPRGASSQLGLLDLLRVESPAEFDVAATWSSERKAPLSAVVGTTLDGEPLHLGFRSDGVHGVIGGTTGSGKSEFLQTLLMSLAMTHRPDELNLFLIDFKGGATFAALSALPHVAGVVTDLEKDASLANRAFTSLEAEMARRKAILDRARVPGIVEYERLPEAASEPMPALLVVIDEFALLVRQQPDVKERLDLVATQGRSLGVHLLLATQSPANVITPSIRSNTQVWVSLRVVDDSESTELLGQRDAARIPQDRPGRGFVRFGGAQTITGFQTARIARPMGGVSVGATVSVRPFADRRPEAGSPVESQATPAPRGRVVTELEMVCETIATQSRAMSARSASPLWLDPLPEMLPAPTGSDGLIHEPGHLKALVGRRDDPARHIQEPFSVDIGMAGNLLIMGARGTGKSTALRQVLLELAEQHAPTELHLYGVESGTGSLSPLASLPQSVAMIAAADRERLYRIFGRLVRLMEKRREDLAASGFTDFRTWRRATAVTEPWVVLAVDDYPSFKEIADGSGLGLLNDQLISLCQGGPAVGIHIVLTSSQSSDMRMNLVNLFGSRILLRQVDAAEYSLLDLRLRANELPPAIPGRALVAGGYEIQVYWSDQSRVEEVGKAWAGADAPEPLVRLSTEIPLASLEDAPGHVIGVVGPEFEPFSLDFGRREPHLVIAGEGRSGKSTTLQTIHQAISRDVPHARFVVFAPRPSPLRNLPGGDENVAVAVSAEEMVTELATLQSRAEPQFLLIDDADSLPKEVGDRLEPILRDADQLNLKTLVAGRSTDLSRSFDGWIRYLLSLRSGILLMPAPDGGHVFDVRLPSSHVALTPGRGFSCERGEARFIQIALPSPEGDEGSERPRREQ